MSNLTQVDPVDPEVTQLTETPETLYAISDLFERMGSRARAIYTARAQIDHEKGDSRYHNPYYTYDGFKIEDGGITLIGSYYNRCDGNQEKEYFINFDDFYDPSYLDQKRAEAEQIKATAAAKKVREEETRRAQQEAADREQYARLQAKFGG
jgi:hypothetical protein